MVAWPGRWERPSTCECIARVVSAPTAAFLPGDSTDLSWVLIENHHPRHFLG